MLAFFSKIFSGIWAYVVIAAAAVVTVLAVIVAAREAGKDSEKVKSARETLDVLKKQRKAAANSPADKPAVVDRMRDGTF